MSPSVTTAEMASPLLVKRALVERALVERARDQRAPRTDPPGLPDGLPDCAGEAVDDAPSPGAGAMGKQGHLRSALYAATAM